MAAHQIELYANNAYSTLANSISDSVETINLAPGTGSRFPSPNDDQFFRLTITGALSPNSSIEIVYVIARSVDALTVIRGREGTTQQAWAVGDLCANEPTAGMFNQFMQPYFGIDESAVPDEYIVNTQQNETNYFNGMPVVFSPNNTNTTVDPVLLLNNISVRPIKTADGQPLAIGQIQPNIPICLMYSPVAGAWLIQSPTAYQKLITGGASTITNNNLTPSRALVSSASGKVATSGASATELSYLEGTTSPVQNQLNQKTEFTDFPFFYDIPSGSGYQKFPSGMYMQWGSVANIPAGSQTITVNLPIAWQIRYMSGVVTDAGGACIPYGITAGVSNASIRIYAPYAILNGVNATLSPVARGITGCTWIAFGF